MEFLDLDDEGAGQEVVETDPPNEVWRFIDGRLTEKNMKNL